MSQEVGVEVRPLMLYHQAKIRREWLKIWAGLGEKVLKLPKWMQDIILQDINTAVQNRITTMEMIMNATRIH